MIESKKNILVVEDDKLLASIFKMYIKNLGHNLVGIASTADDSIKKCKDLAPDLVLMDINLKGEHDGIHATQMIQETTDIPVVYITGETNETTFERALSTNTYGYLVKPITKGPLEQNIQFAIQKHNQYKSLSINDKRVLSLVSKSTQAIAIISNEIIRVINPVAMNMFSIKHFHQIVDQPFSILVDDRSWEQLRSILQDLVTGSGKFKKYGLNCIDFNQALVPVIISGSRINFDKQDALQLIFTRFE